jgi:hypothetical protein
MLFTASSRARIRSLSGTGAGDVEQILDDPDHPGERTGRVALQQQFGADDEGA